MQEYNNIDQIIHQLSQVLAKVNRTYVPKKEDDSHTNLYFDPISHRIYGRWIDSPLGKLILALNLEQLSFEWLNNKNEVIQNIPIEGSSYFDIESAIEKSLSRLDLNKRGFKDVLHFEIPGYTFLKKNFKKIRRDQIELWEKNRELVNLACFELMGYFQVMAEVRIWPHHFDTGVYIEPNESTGIGFGLAMKDELIGMPYFYLSGYRLDRSSYNYSDLSNLSNGKWIIEENWQGAVFPLKSLRGNNVGLKIFLREASDWFIENS